MISLLIHIINSNNAHRPENLGDVSIGGNWKLVKQKRETSSASAFLPPFLHLTHTRYNRQNYS